MHTTPNTAIIGAGINGLTTAKNLSDAGVDFDCFESFDRVGGNWAFRNPNGHSSAVHLYPCDHFDVYPGAAHDNRLVGHQVAFLRRIMATSGARSTA